MPTFLTNLISICWREKFSQLVQQIKQLPLSIKISAVSSVCFYIFIKQYLRLEKGPSLMSYSGSVIGHRGARLHFEHIRRREVPENTIQSLSYALENGADGIEFDIRLIKSGEFVLFHDGALGNLLFTPRTSECSVAATSEYVQNNNFKDNFSSFSGSRSETPSAYNNYNFSVSATTSSLPTSPLMSTSAAAGTSTVVGSGVIPINHNKEQQQTQENMKKHSRSFSVESTTRFPSRPNSATRLNNKNLIIQQQQNNNYNHQHHHERTISSTSNSSSFSAGDSGVNALSSRRVGVRANNNANPISNSSSSEKETQNSTTSTPINFSEPKKQTEEKKSSPSSSENPISSSSNIKLGNKLNRRISTEFVSGDNNNNNNICNNFCNESSPGGSSISNKEQEEEDEMNYLENDQEEDEESNDNNNGNNSGTTSPYVSPKPSEVQIEATEETFLNNNNNQKTTTTSTEVQEQQKKRITPQPQVTITSPLASSPLSNSTAASSSSTQYKNKKKNNNNAYTSTAFATTSTASTMSSTSVTPSMQYLPTPSASVLEANATFDNLTLLEIKALRFADSDCNVTVPSFSEVVDFCERKAVEKVFVEIKSMSLRYSRLADLADRYCLFYEDNKEYFDSCVVTISFHPILLYMIRSRKPELPVCLLHEPHMFTEGGTIIEHEKDSFEILSKIPKPFLRCLDWALFYLNRYFFLDIIGASMYGPEIGFIDDKFLETCFEKDICVYQWGLKHPSEISTCLRRSGTCFSCDDAYLDFKSKYFFV